MVWNAIQCAVQGRGHLKNNIPCQDKTYACSQDSIDVIALADGAGSASLSHHGASYVTRHMCELLRDNFDSFFNNDDGIAVKQTMLTHIYGKLDDLAFDLGCRYEDLASTLLLVAVKEDNFIIAHIGDGVIGYLKNNELKIASQPDNGEFVNETIFTTSANVIKSMKLIKGKLGAIQGFVLMSDGSEASLYNKKERRLADVLKKIMLRAMHVEAQQVQRQIQESFEQVIIKATMDDCSIALLVKDEEGFLHLSTIEKCNLLALPRTSSKRIIKRYDEILLLLQQKHDLTAIAQHIHLKEKYTQRYVDKLCALNFVTKDEDKYLTCVTL